MPQQSLAAREPAAYNRSSFFDRTHPCSFIPSRDAGRHTQLRRLGTSTGVIDPSRCRSDAWKASLTDQARIREIGLSKLHCKDYTGFACDRGRAARICHTSVTTSARLILLLTGQVLAPKRHPKTLASPLKSCVRTAGNASCNSILVNRWLNSVPSAPIDKINALRRSSIQCFV